MSRRKGAARYIGQDTEWVSGCLHTACAQQLYKFSHYADPRLEDRLDAYVNSPTTDETDLYALAEQIARALGSETAFNLRPWYNRAKEIKQCILLATLADYEIICSNWKFIDRVARNLNTSNKRLAQTITIFLLTCGGKYGLSTLAETLLQTVFYEHLSSIKEVVRLLEAEQEVVKAMGAYVNRWSATKGTPSDWLYTTKQDALDRYLNT